MAFQNGVFTNKPDFYFNLTFSGPSPFNATSITNGAFNPSHTSTATLVYTPQTVPTPWLVLTFGYIHSFVTLLLGIKRIWKTKRRSTLKKIFTLCNTIYTCYRFIAVFHKSILSMHNPEVPTEDVFQLDFMAVSGMAHMSSDIFDDAPVINWLIKACVLLLSILLVVPSWQSALRVIQRKEPYYSKWKIVGGNCPLPVGSCQHLKYFGCGQETLSKGLGIASKDPNIINSANYLRIFEFIGAIQTFIGWILSSYLYFLSVAAIVVIGWRIVVTLAKGFEISMNQDEDTEELMSSLAQAAVVIFIQSIPAIVLTAIQESNPKSIYVVDSFGPLVPATVLLPGQNYTGGNSTSWSDCFEIRAPSDKWGFLGHWANSTKMVQKIALL